MKNNYWQKILYTSPLIQWGSALSCITILSLVTLTYILLPAYRSLNVHKKSWLMREEQASTLLIKYRQNEANPSLQQKVRQWQKNPRRSFDEIVLTGAFPITHWLQDDRQQEVNLLLGWQQFLLFLQHIRALNTTQLPISLNLQAQENAIAVQIIYSLQKQ